MKNVTRLLTKGNGLLHIETSALIVLVLVAFLPWWVASAITFAIGIAKELYDKGHDGVASWGDIGCDVAGILIGLFIAIL